MTNVNYMLFQNSSVKTWDDTKKDILRWEKLQLSLWEKISVIKMNVLPRMLFLFQAKCILTTEIPFKQWKKDVDF